MRTATALSIFFLGCGIAAAFGFPTIQISGEPVLGLYGLLVGTILASAPPLAVLAYREWRRGRT